MGDRSSIYITSTQFKGTIQLYGHWAGEDNAVAVANVLNNTDRVGDPMYLTAQLFYQFAVVQGGYTGSIGFGIGSVDYISTGDDSAPIVINADTGEVAYRGEYHTQDEFVNKFGEFLNTEVGK